MTDSGDEPSLEPPEELAEWEADDGEEFFRWELPGELFLAEPLVEVAARDPDEAERFFEEPELELDEDVPEDRVPEEEELFFFAEELPEEDFFTGEVDEVVEDFVEEPEEL
ncbi:MAG: hypothetical protein WAN16_04000 [Chthoniobacterales bacterium]